MASTPPGWRVVYRNHLTENNAFTGVLAFSRTNTWAVGLKGSNGVGFIKRWNGRSWRLSTDTGNCPVAVMSSAR